jgi:hypothetical protein
MDEFESVGQSLDATGTRETEIAQRIRERDAARRGVDRTFIVKCVMSLYAISVCAAILYLFYKGLWGGEDTFDNIADLIKTAVIPVVTFVIGYYFAAERHE